MEGWTQRGLVFQILIILPSQRCQNEWKGTVRYWHFHVRQLAGWGAACGASVRAILIIFLAVSRVLFCSFIHLGNSEWQRLVSKARLAFGSGEGLGEIIIELLEKEGFFFFFFLIETKYKILRFQDQVLRPVAGQGGRLPGRFNMADVHCAPAGSGALNGISGHSNLCNWRLADNLCLLGRFCGCHMALSGRTAVHTLAGRCRPLEFSKSRTSLLCLLCASLGFSFLPSFLLFKVFFN